MSPERQRVEDIVRAFVEAWNRHDMEAFADLFADDAEFVNLVGLWWKGRAKIREAHVATHATLFKRSRLSLDEIAVRFVRPDVAVARASWRMTGHVSPLGNALPERQGVLVNLIVHNSNVWKIVDAQNTDIADGDLAPPQ